MGSESKMTPEILTTPICHTAFNEEGFEYRVRIHHVETEIPGAKEVGVMMTKRALSTDVVLIENPVANFKIRELEDELEARGLGWDATRPMRLAKRVACHRKDGEESK